MGDRCSLNIWYRPVDAERVRAICLGGEAFEFTEDQDDGSLRSEESEANYAWYSEACELAEAGIPFVIYHSAGSDYCSGVSACDGLTHIFHDTADSDRPSVTLGPDGKVARVELGTAQAALAVIDRAWVALGRAVPATSPPATLWRCDTCRGTEVEAVVSVSPNTPFEDDDLDEATHDATATYCRTCEDSRTISKGEL